MTLRRKLLKHAEVLMKGIKIQHSSPHFEKSERCVELDNVLMTGERKREVGERKGQVGEQTGEVRERKEEMEERKRKEEVG